MLGAVLEGSRNVYWNLTPVQNLRYFAALRRVPTSITQRRIKELLTGFDLWEKRDAPAGSLSRGMQQKLAITCALIADPGLLLLDEPTLGLDVSAASHITTMLTRLTKDQGKAVLLTTHDMKLAEEISGRVAVINQGQLIKIATPQELVQLVQRSPWRIVCDGEVGEPVRLDLARRYTHSVLEHSPGQSKLLVEMGESDDEQAVLHGVLEVLRRHGVKALSVDRQGRDLKDAFLTLTQEASIGKYMEPVHG